MKASCARQRAPGGLSARLPGTQECPADATAAGTAWQWPSGLRAVLGAVARAPSRFSGSCQLVNDVPPLSFFPAASLSLLILIFSALLPIVEHFVVVVTYQQIVCIVYRQNNASKPPILLLLYQKS
jgi:hypothetical protein